MEASIGQGMWEVSGAPMPSGTSLSQHLGVFEPLNPII